MDFWEDHKSVLITSFQSKRHEHVNMTYVWWCETWLDDEGNVYQILHYKVAFSLFYMLFFRSKSLWIQVVIIITLIIILRTFFGTNMVIREEN